MSYICTDFSSEENWSFGEHRLMYNFTATVGDIVAIGFVGRDWIAPFSSSWNISTTFSLTRRNDTGRINSSPRAITAPIIRLQEGCNHTIALAVNDPDGDIIRCRWAEGSECAGICNQFPGADLDPYSCTIKYQANRGARFWAAALMIEDFIPESTWPLSSVALQFLVLVIESTEPCSQAPEFIQPTIRQGSCVAIPPEMTFVTQLIANSGGSSVTIVEIQTVSPLGTRRGELQHVLDTNTYFVNITWTPDVNQQNETHLFCFTAVNSEGVASEQTCLQLLPGYYSPMPIQATATPNQQLVHPSNTTWSITFDTSIERPSIVSFITFHEFISEEEVYRIDVSLSDEVSFELSNKMLITPSYSFEEKRKFYINLERGVVQGLQECGPGNEPIKDKHFWTFETTDVTPPTITFLKSPSVSNSNISLIWESNENVTWDCTLQRDTIEFMVNCSAAYWSGYDLREGVYHLAINATDEAGNVATVTHTFEVDLTPPTTTLVQKPLPLSNQLSIMLAFTCNEVCSFECQFLSSTMPQEILISCNRGFFNTPILQHNGNHTFVVVGTDQVGNKGEPVTCMWETDFESPLIFGVQNLSVLCNETNPEYTGLAQVEDDRSEVPSLMYDDVNVGCSIKRTWTAVDEAGNVGHLTQNLDLEFFPSVSLSPQVALPCDDTSLLVQVPTSTASAPNPCGLPLQLIHVDSVSEYLCPSDFVRNWTVSGCGRSLSISQNITLYGLCPLYACGRNESTPHGICSRGECQCNRPWYGEECNTLIYIPVAEPVNDTILQEAQPYTATVTLIQGTIPLSWTLVSGPDQLRIDQYTSQVTWDRAQAGNYTISVLIENQVGKAEVSWSLQVNPGYNTLLSSISPTVYPQAQPVSLAGYVEYVENNFVEDFFAGIVQVYIDITSNGATRTIRTFTERDGTFSLTFYPAATEYGTYIARARHPNSSLEVSPQAEWIVLGLTSIPKIIVLNGETVSEFEKTFHNATVVYNDGPRALSGLTATPILTNTQDVAVEVQLQGISSNHTLEPGGKIVMDIKVIASRPLSRLFTIRFETAQGTTLQIIVNLHIDQILPSFLIDPPSLNARIIRGKSKVFEFNITNVGSAAAQSIHSILPATDFISFVSFGSPQQSEGDLSLETRESAILSILTQIPANQQLGEISASIVITSGEVSTAIPIKLHVSSDILLNLTVIVEDEYTYFASGQPLVSNASITLINYQRGIRITQTTEIDNGKVTFINLYEDCYEMFVEAPEHRTLRQIMVTSVNNPKVIVFIERQAVAYTWTVTPVTFQDTYVLTIEADFKTHVPIPVVTVTPAEIDLDELELGLITSFQLNITNHGLIRANDVSIRFPNNHPFIRFTTDNDELGNLEPLSSFIISVHVSRKSVQKRSTDTCLSYSVIIQYSYVCGAVQYRSAPVVLTRTVTNRDGIRCGLRRLRGSGSGSFTFIGYTTTTRLPCNTNKCLQTVLLSCATLLLPPVIGCLPLIPAKVNPFDSVIDALSWIQCATGNKYLGIALCAYGVYEDCLSLVFENRKKRNLESAVNELVEAMYPIHQSIALGVEVLGDELWISVEDPRWLTSVLRPALDDTSEAGVLISTTELSAIMAAPPPNGTTTEIVARMVERVNNTLDGWNNGQLEPQDSSNMASFSAVQKFTQDIRTYNEIAKRKGFASYLDAYSFASSEIRQNNLLVDEEGVCAVVRIRIEQELALTREAFLAKLEIENQDDVSLEQIKIEILITDVGTGQQATHLFSINNGTLSGSLSSTNRGWVLPSEMSGAVEWLIIPYSEAAPESDQSYDVGGTLRYSLDGENITIPLLPTVITVRPDPSLLVHYFWERYIVGDDPFTDEVEPSVPFTLGVAVKNAGHGTAYSLQITSGQPEIIENEKGLLINFMIIGANIGSENISPSLTVMFGDLAPNTTKVARWLMISSLQGEFMNYSAMFQNINPLGDPELSILDELEIHELIRNVMIYSDPNEDDGILDFLVNERNDFLAYPDALYSSKTLERYTVNAGTILSVHTTSDLARSLEVRTSSNSTGWVYYRYEDTEGILSGTASIVNGTKSKGNEVVVIPPENSWITRN